MPAPAVFADGAIDPLPEQAPPIAHDRYGLLYASDRKPAESTSELPFYLDEPGVIVRLGRARIHAGDGMDWETARQVSLATERSGPYPMEVASVEETSVLESTYNFLTRKPEGAPIADRTGERFAALVDERFEASGVRDVYIFVHGYRVVFSNPVLVSAELWHFLGYRGAFIAYAWPSTPRALAYMSDLETAEAMARKFRLFLTYLREKTAVERIHIVGYSAGSRLVVRALEQLALLEDDSSDAAIREKLRIGNVIIAAGDVSREGFGAALMDGLLRIPERTVIYMSSTDRALALSRKIFQRERLGQVWDVEPSARVGRFLRARSSLELVDVSDAAGSSAGAGHAYFRDSPWVSSDILVLLAHGLSAEERGLVEDASRLVWTFPPDYVERLRRSLVERGYAGPIASR